MENGNIVQTLPQIPFERRMCPLFTPISPIRCSGCGNLIKPNENYDQFIISSYSIIKCPITRLGFARDPKCRKHHADTILGVTGSGNYSDEYLEKQKYVRYNGQCSLWNSRIGMCLAEAKKPRDFTRLTQEYSIRHGTLVSFIFYILLLHTFL